MNLSENIKIYKIDFYIDTGYDYINKTAVVLANTEKDSIEKLHDWIAPKLHGEKFAELDDAKVEEIQINNDGIIFHNVFYENGTFKL